MTRDEYMESMHDKAVAAAHRVNCNVVFDRDDLVQEAMLAALQSYERYDGRVKPWTYAERRVYGALIDAIRKSDGGKRDIEWRKKNGITRRHIPLEAFPFFYGNAPDGEGAA